MDYKFSVITSTNVYTGDKGGFFGIAPYGQYPILTQLYEKKLIGDEKYTFSRKRNERDSTMRLGTPDEKSYKVDTIKTVDLDAKDKNHHLWRVHLAGIEAGSMKDRTEVKLTGNLKYAHVDPSVENF